ncbi:MAG: type II secretion system F family protein [Candidatus Omnitrophica bacterium]|jgi:type IV pilus assembly protein PilC|nr:type II secretion system F family protein [Candidatus Omnitrophota bacterium]
MAKFTYTARDQKAQSITGVIEAQEKSSAVKELKKRGLTIIDLFEGEGQKKFSSLSFGGAKIKSMDLVVFSRQLATLIDSGVSLITALNVLHDQVENPKLKEIIVNIKNDIESGNSLSASFAKYPKAFPGIFTNMIKAGESSGSLNEILERVADYLERSENLSRKVKSSMTYPTLVVGMAGIIIAFLMIKVVPTFKNIFTSLGGNLPAPTQFLITASDLSVRYFPVLFILVIVGIVALNRYISSASGRINFDSFKLKMPIFGVIISKICISRFTRTLATLVKSGVSILEAFEIAGKVSGNKIIEMATEQIRSNMRAGENISEPMEETGKFPPFVVKMIAVGEQTGELERMLTKISDYYETQVNDSMSEMTSMIEPLIISFLGVTIGFIVVAMFMPIFQLTTLINK